MQTISLYAAAVTSYVVAFVSMFFAHAIEQSSAIVGFLGFILLVARLVQEVPKAWEVIARKKAGTDGTS